MYFNSYYQGQQKKKQSSLSFSAIPFQSKPESNMCYMCL